MVLATTTTGFRQQPAALVNDLRFYLQIIGEECYFFIGFKFEIPVYSFSEVIFAEPS